MTATSARGLFRATGKAAKPVKIRDLSGAIVDAAALPRATDDFQPTPPDPTRAFAAAELARLREFSGLWEPAAGDGAMLRILSELGLPVFASDLVDRGCGATIRDFYDFRQAPAPAIFTNPPFCETNWRDGKARWIRHALETLGVPYMALLMPWNWPGAGGLARLWREHPPARVYLMRWKIDFTGQGSPPSHHAWFVWDGAPAGSHPTLHMLDRADARQASLFEAA